MRDRFNEDAAASQAEQRRPSELGQEGFPAEAAIRSSDEGCEGATRFVYAGGGDRGGPLRAAGRDVIDTEDINRSVSESSSGHEPPPRTVRLQLQENSDWRNSMNRV